MATTGKESRPGEPEAALDGEGASPGDSDPGSFFMAYYLKAAGGPNEE
jgi:hypothetical protein